MKRVKLTLLLHFATLFLCPFIIFGQQKNVYNFSFNLNTSANTSAGVFKKDGTLVRTLWSAVKYSQGTHAATWDGKDDNGTFVFDTSLVYKVLSNNVSYTWEGVIGNSSSSNSDNTLHHGYDIFKSMAIVGNTAYVGIGYNEAWPSKEKIDLTTPQQKKWILPSGQGSTQQTDFVTSDGTLVYWGETDPYNTSHSWIHATDVNSDSQVSFNGGVAFDPTHSIHYNSVIDLTNSTDARISSLAVQKSGRFLFVAHGAINELRVFDKKSGYQTQTLSVTHPRGLSVDSDDNLWMISGDNTVSKYRVNEDGSLTAATLTLTGLEKALATQVSTDGSCICVVDGGTSQQIKAFNNNSGSIIWTLGQAGGYATTSDVTNDKFMFGNSNYLAFESDGSFWVGDGGNYRNMHFSQNRSFIEAISYLPVTYSISVDENNPARVFGGFLEYAIDYSRPLAVSNGSWTLVKNWAYNAPANNDFNESFKTTYTLSNGRTYSCVKDPLKFMELVELVAGGNMRRTGIYYPPEYWLSADGSLSKQTKVDPGGGYTKWTKKPLIGFDGSNNPIWGEEVQVDQSPFISDNDPAFRGIGMTYKPNEVTIDGIRPNFDGGNSVVPFHIGGVKNGKMLWESGKSTNYDYQGDFPSNGDFDIGNGVNNFAGSNALAIGKSIFWGYHGEFWKNGQTNVWNHLYEDGLMIGQFGTSTGAYKEGYPGMAGNAFSTKLVSVGDSYYLYHNDESYHSGIHRFKVSGLNSISEQEIPVINNASASTQPSLDLMAGLPFKDVLKDGTNGWKRYPNVESDNFSAKTSVRTYNTLNGDDIFMTFNEGAGNCNVTRDLGTYTGVSGWNLSGKVTWAGSGPNYTNGKGGVFLEVLDNAGKVITRFYYTTNYAGDASHIIGNNVEIASGDIDHIQKDVVGIGEPLDIKVTNGAVTFKYGDYEAVSTTVLADADANWQNPQTLRVKFIEDNVVHYGKTFDIANMQFTKDSTSSTPIAVSNVNDLMTGLPYKGILVDGTKGWNRSAKSESAYFSAKTSLKTDNTDNGDDIFMTFNEGAGNCNVTRDLGTNTGVSSWDLSGKVTWSGSVPNYTNGKGGVFLEVLDNAGKVITRFYYTTNYAGDASHIIGNNVEIASGDIDQIQNSIAAKTQSLEPLDIKVTNGAVTFKYGDYEAVSTTVLADADANWQNPQTLRVKFIEDNVVHYGKTFDIANMQFTKDSTSSTPIAVSNVNDLMTGLPYKGILVDGTKGWNRSAKSESAYFSAKTSLKTDNTDNGDDIFMTFNEGAGNCNVTRDLGTNTGVSSWDLSGKVTWSGSVPNYTNGKGGVFLEVLDNAGKVITRFYYTTNYAGDASHIIGNNVEIASGDIDQIQNSIAAKTQSLEPLDIKVTNGAVTFKYGDYEAVSTTVLADADANWQNPQTLRVKFIEDNVVHYGKTFDIANMQFTKDSTSSTPIAVSNVNDLMTGLPYKGILVDGTKGWNRSAKSESAYFSAKTSLKTDNTDNGDDIFMTFNEGAGNCNVTRDLGTNTGVSSWDLSGKVTWSGSVPNYTNGKGGVFLEVLDNAGKVITRFYYTTNYAGDASHIIGNNVEIASGDIDQIQNSIAAKTQSLEPLDIKVTNGAVTFKYGDYEAVSTTVLADADANWQNPQTLRVKFIEDNVVHYGKTFDIANMQFTKDSTSSTPIAVSNVNDLMTGLPYKGILVDGTKGWNRSAKSESAYFSAKTSLKTDNTDNGDDIFMTFNEGAGNCNVTRDLGTNTGVSSWDLSGKVTWSGSVPNYTNGKGGVFLEVLDNAGKVITRFYYTTNYAGDASHIIGNNVEIASGDIDQIQNSIAAKTQSLEPLDIKVTNGAVTFKYGDYEAVSTTVLADADANWQNPQTLRVKFIEDNVVHYGKTFDIANMQFTKDSTSSTPIAVSNVNDLMTGLPYKGILVDGTKGWNRSAKSESAYFSAKTSLKTDNTDNGDDIFMTFNEGAGNCNVTRDLGTNTGVSSWDLSGKVTWSGSVPNYTNGKGGVFLEVLDNAGKVITRFYYTTNYAGDASHIIGNNVEIASGDIDQIQNSIAAKTQSLEPLDIKVTNGAVTFKYGDYEAVSTTVLADADANWQNPQTLRVKFIEDNVVHYGKTFDIANMQFTKTATSVNVFRTDATGILDESFSNDLDQNLPLLKTYPNPFETTLNIDVNVQHTALYSVGVYDSYGVLVKSIYQGNLEKGRKTFVFSGGNLKPGIYICRLISDTGSISKQVTYIGKR